MPRIWFDKALLLKGRLELHMAKGILEPAATELKLVTTRTLWNILRKAESATTMTFPIHLQLKSKISKKQNGTK